MHIDGACHCGQIAYEAEVDRNDVTICHCKDCQRLTGSAYRVTVTARRSSFLLTSGKPKEYVKIAANGRKRMHYFCGNCGSPIFTTGEMEDAEQVGIRLGTINQRRELEPTAQFWCSSEFPWAQNLSKRPRHAE